jgi:hypothetical protein
MRKQRLPPMSASRRVPMEDGVCAALGPLPEPKDAPGAALDELTLRLTLRILTGCRDSARNAAHVGSGNGSDDRRDARVLLRAGRKGDEAAPHSDRGKAGTRVYGQRPLALRMRLCRLRRLTFELSGPPRYGSQGRAAKMYGVPTAGPG